MTSALLSSVARRAITRIAALRRHIDVLFSAPREVLSGAQFKRGYDWAKEAITKAERQLASFASMAALRITHAQLSYTGRASDGVTRGQVAVQISVILRNSDKYLPIISPTFDQAWDARYAE